MNLRTLLALVVTFGFAASAFAEVKIGYVDLQRAIQSTDAGKQAKSNLEQQYNKKKQELQKKEGELKELTKDLEKKQGVLSREVFQQKQADLQREMLKFREMAGKSEMELQRKQQALMQPILETMKDTIAKIAKKEKFTLILERSEDSVVWANKSLDITPKVVKAFNENHSKK